MITIRCTESEKRKLCENGYFSVVCGICYKLGACKEFDGHCSKCRKHRSKYIEWEIISKPKQQKSSNGDTRSCCNCWANEHGMCIENSSPFYKLPIEEIMKTQQHCDVYGAYEGDG